MVLLIAQYLFKVKSVPIRKKEIVGSSPPLVFISRYNYPKVFVYPTTPPEIGDTSYYENYEYWLNANLDDFLIKRLSLVRGGIMYSVEDAQHPNKVLYDIQMMAISSRPITLELKLKTIPKGAELSGNYPPIGPSAPLDKMSIIDLYSAEKQLKKYIKIEI